MRILFVLEHFYPYIGGVEFLFLQLSRSLVEKGNSVKVITTRFDKTLPLNEDFEGIEIERVDCGNRFSFSYKAIPAVLKNANEYELIHTSTYNAAVPAWIGSFLKRKKCILTFHEFWGQLWKQLPFLSGTQRVLYGAFERMVSLLPFTKVVAVSDFTKTALLSEGIRKDKVVRIYNGLNYAGIEELLNEKEGMENESAKNNFIFVGRLGVSKGYDLIFPAVDRILTEYKEVVFNMIIPQRPADMFDTVMGKINQMKNKSQLKVFHNLTKQDLYSKIKAARFILVPSYSEGFCFIAAEACAMGVPVVSSGKGA